MKTKCPGCQAVYNIKPYFLHKKTTCQNCGRGFVIERLGPAGPAAGMGLPAAGAPSAAPLGWAEPPEEQPESPEEIAPLFDSFGPPADPGWAAKGGGWRARLSAVSAHLAGGRFLGLALALAALAGGLVGAGLMGLARQGDLDKQAAELAAVRQQFQALNKQRQNIEDLKKELSRWQEESRRLAETAYPAGSIPQVLAEAAGLEYKLTEALLAQRISALESGAKLTATAKATATDPKLAAALAEEMSKIQAELEAGRPRAESLAEPARSQAQTALATQELNLAILNRNRLIAKYGLSASLPSPAPGPPG